MEVAVPEEPQKKIFRARKTMKMSDRQQLEVLHGTLASTGSNASSPSSRPETPLVNGTHADDGQEMDKESGSKSPMSECSPPPSRSLSRSSSPAVGQNVLPSPALKDSESVEGEREKEDEKEDVRPETPKDEKTEIPKSASTESELASDSKSDIKKVTASNGDLSMDTDGTGLDHVAAEEKSSKSSSSSPFGSPAASLECDPEVKEGFLCLSEEDEGQGEQDEVKEEKMEVELPVKKEAEKGCKAADGTGNSTPVGKKRSLSPVEMNDDCKDKEIKEERDGKRARVEGVQLEAQLELKITANAGSRLKLQKVVQQLVEERLRVLQLTVFDRNLQELKDRVDKIDATTKQQNTVQHTLQSKIARLAKKFGAANQATENSKKAPEPPVAAKAAPVANTTPTTQRTVRTTLDQKQLTVPPGSSSSTATPTQPKPLSTPNTQTSSALGAPAPILQIISTTTNSTPSSSSSSLSGQAQTGALLLQPRTNTGGMTNNTATTAGQPVSIQPLLIQLPLAMANGQGGAIAGGVGLIPVSSLASVSSISKAKTTTATTFILQKTAGNLVPSSSSTSLSSLSSTTVTQMPQNRMVYQGGTVTASSPSAGISVSTARAPTQSAAVVGMATVSSSPATTGPAATGSAAAVNGPPSASEMASKTDNQATNLAPAKSAAQPARPKGSVIDLTEDDDDVQGGLTVEWWEEMDKTEETEKKRHAEINDEEIDKLIVKLRHEESTVKQTTWSIRCFQTWCCEKNVSIDFKTITKTELNQILRQFYATVKNGRGESYGLSSYICLRAGLNRYINDPPLSLSWCILQDPDFTTSNSVFLGVVRKLRRESREQATHCNAITDEDFFKIKHSQALCPDTPVGLVSKVWFDLQLHLGPRGKEGNRQLKLDSIVILKDENGLKYATLTSNDITKTPKQMNDRTRESRPGFMYEQPGDPLCPISSLEKYVSLLPLNPPAFYLHPKKTIGTNDTWYTREPIGVNFLASMLPRICRAAGIKPVYTNHCLQSSTVQKLMLAWKQGKLCLSGHQSESYLHHTSS